MKLNRTPRNKAIQFQPSDCQQSTETYIGKKTTSLINCIGKTEYLHVEELNETTISLYKKSIQVDQRI
jgi:hypothetical protein